jgi:hypothetical protein
MGINGGIHLRPDRSGAMVVDIPGEHHGKLTRRGIINDLHSAASFLFFLIVAHTLRRKLPKA